MGYRIMLCFIDFYHQPFGADVDLLADIGLGIFHWHWDKYAMLWTQDDFWIFINYEFQRICYQGTVGGLQ